MLNCVDCENGVAKIKTAKDQKLRCVDCFNSWFEKKKKGDEDSDEDESLLMPRVKSLKYCYEKDIVMYAYFGKLNYFSTECTYVPNAYRMNARSFFKDLERIRPCAILDLVRAGESLRQRRQNPIPLSQHQHPVRRDVAEMMANNAHVWPTKF